MEFYIKNIEDPNFNVSQLHSDEDISQLLIQIETLLFTTKGEVLGDPNFGTNLTEYVYSFRYNDYMLKKAVEDQIKSYIPLAAKYNTQVDVDFTTEMDRHLVFVSITIDSKYRVGLYI